MAGKTQFMKGTDHKYGAHTVRKMAWAATLAATLVPASAFAQDVQGTARVGILDDSRVSKTADLDFGRILAGEASGSITVAPDGGVQTSGTVTSLGGTQPSAFMLERQIGRDYIAYRAPRFSDTIEIVHESDASVTMTVTEFTTDFDRTKQGVYYIRRGNRFTGPFTGQVPGYWNQTSYDFRVGAKLAVDPNQLAGNYSGTFTVTIDYD